MRAADRAAELLGRRDGDPRASCADCTSPAQQTAAAPRAHRRLGRRGSGSPPCRCATTRTPTASSPPSPATSDRWPTTSPVRCSPASRRRRATLLRRTSICDPIPTALAAELSGRRDAADVLGALERTTGLVVASGPHRTEFRIQELMRTYLTADLYRHGPAPGGAAAPSGPRRGGRPRTDRSRRCATRPRRPTARLLTGYLHRWAPELVARGEHTELRRALAVGGAGSAPPTDAWLPLVSAQIHLGNGDREAARADVRRARAAGRRTRRRATSPTSGRRPQRLAGLDGPGARPTGRTRRRRRWPRSRSPDGAPPSIFAAEAGGPADAGAVLGDLEAALAAGP